MFISKNSVDKTSVDTDCSSNTLVINASDLFPQMLLSTRTTGNSKFNHYYHCCFLRSCDYENN